MADVGEALKPPGVEEGDDSEIFENFEELINDLDVLDECGESENEGKSPKDENKRKQKRRRSDSRGRRSSGHRRSRSKSRERQKSRDLPPRRSPPANRNGVKTAGAASFLAELKKKFGDFPELVEMNKPSARRQAEREIRHESRQQGRNNNRYNQNQQKNQNFQQGWNQGNMGPMQYGPGMQGPQMYGPNMMGPVMNPNMMSDQMMNPNMMPGPHMMQGPQMMPGPHMMPGQQMMPGFPMMPGQHMMPGMGMEPMPMNMQGQGLPMPQMVPPADAQQMNDGSHPELSMPLQLPARRSIDRSNSSRYSRSPSRSSRQITPPREQLSRSPDRRNRSRSRSGSRDRYRQPDRYLTDRNRSTSYRPNIDLGEITCKLYADKNISLADYLASKASGSASVKTVDAQRDRVISKCKAAVHMLDHPNDIEYNLRFLFVPPNCKATAADKPGISPVLPSKHNPLFHSTTNRPEAVNASKPFQNIPANLLTLIRQMGLDESWISEKLDENVIASRLLEARNHATAATFAAPQTVRPKMVDSDTQTPPLVCYKCERRDKIVMVNMATQVKKKEFYAASSQTTETDITLAKLKYQTWEREQRNAFKRERGDDSDESSAKRPSIGPPGYRKEKELKDTKKVLDAYYSSREKTYGYSYRH